MKFDFGFKVGDILYVAYPKYNKACKFKTDCIKVFEDNVTAHGYVYNLYGNWGTPTEISIKYLNKRVIFTKKKDAMNWMNSKKENN